MEAVCIGINNYPAPDQLNGCVHDALDWAAWMRGKGFQVKVLLDEDATKRSILESIGSLVDNLTPGSVGAITFSGHGTWVPDLSGDESDRRDECLCAYPEGGHYDGVKDLIVDDELHAIFTRIPDRSYVWLVTDSCHSGTVAKFSSRNPHSQIKVKFLPPGNFLASGKDGGKIMDRIVRTAACGKSRGVMDEAPPGVIHLSGCKDKEYSYDGLFRGRAQGALTHYALLYLRSRQDITYRNLIRKIHNNLPSGEYPQTPQLNDGSNLADLRVLEPIKE